MRAPTTTRPPVRLRPELRLPSYRYVPGRHPHPNRHADGHNFLAGVQWGQSAWDPARSWTDDRRYLFGHDLFANRYFWESHEVWEELWHAIPHDRLERRLVQGLIQTAATTLKHVMGHDRARTRLADRAIVHLQAASPLGPTVWGVDIERLVTQLEDRNAWPTIPITTTPVRP